MTLELDVRTPQRPSGRNQKGLRIRRCRRCNGKFLGESGQYWCGCEPRDATAHRRPPMPPAYDEKAPWGTCKWCGEEILGGDGEVIRRRRWHPGCLSKFNLLTNPTVQRWAVQRRDKRVCAGCGQVAGYWEVDHIVPLWKVAELPDEERRPYFELDNLQTLCGACHNAKCAAEAAERAALRREDPRQGWLDLEAEP